jgi:acetyl esterase/lipase
LAGALGLAAVVPGAQGRRGAEAGGVEARPGLAYRLGRAGPARLDLYLPAGDPPPGGWPLVVAIHGGGWLGGERGEYGRSLGPLVRRGVALASIDYRLSRPGRPGWPGNLDDVRAAVRWLRRHAAEYRLDPDRVAALGASAGGHLAALLATRHGDDPGSRVAAAVVFYGPSDLAALHEHLGADGPVARMLGAGPGEAPGRYEAASPLAHVTRDDPPMLLIHGALDPTVPLGQSRRLAGALAAAGVRHRLIEVEGAAHGFGLRAGKLDLTADILEFLAESWEDGAQSRGPGPPVLGGPGGSPGGPLLLDEPAQTLE